ncbi:MAG TPA: hypothetical protein VJM11_05140 [Nevskiaceae bacterium]|nr:hypothetical protein [Nevskiaceae bacterium]
MPKLQLLSAALVTALGLLAGLAQAGVLRGTSRPMHFLQEGGQVTVPLDVEGKTAIYFHTTETWSTVIVSFTAECSIDGASGTANEARVNLDIKVDGNILSPTNGGSDTFCSSNPSEALDGHAMAAINVLAKLPAGRHKLQIIARAITIATGELGSNTFELNAMSLIVHD